VSLPSLSQHRALKDREPDALLLFRDGDQYMALHGDAERVAALLGLGPIATGATVAFLARDLESNLARLVAAGERVAICEQLTATPPPSAPHAGDGGGGGEVGRG
jgi:DNA mismatch repair protein MutS